MPASHEVEVKLPAVSGSSGRLVVEREKEEQEKVDYPGRVFEDQNLDYSEAMKQFVEASQKKDRQQVQNEVRSEEMEKTSLKAKKQALRQEKEALTLSRRQVRQQRKQEDAVWQTLKDKRRQQQAERNAQLQSGQKAMRGTKKAQDEHWRHLRQQRHHLLKQRDLENEHYRQQLALLRHKTLALPLVTAWIAILVVTDNCTRQCLGLPLFVTGNNVTADLVVEALRTLLPPQLQFLISDRGVHFTAQVFRQLATDENFIHVLIARHRPQSNGIAERFVRTLKEWLANKSWQSHLELDLLLKDFLNEYNNRPHQNLPIPGLSPNEFAHRIWLF